MSIVSLSLSNFDVITQTNGKHLITTVPGNALVFFKKIGCPACSVMEPMYQQVSKENGSLTYGIVDLQYNNGIVKMSRDTSTPIQTVPQLFMYANGRPFARFKGTRTIQSIREFITSCMSRIQQTQQSPQYPTYNNPSSFVGGGNMYGGQTNYGGAQMQMPDSNVPRQASQVAYGNKVAMSNHPSMQQQCDPDDEDCLMIPQNVIPHNLPWESDFRKYIDTGKI